MQAAFTWLAKQSYQAGEDIEEGGRQKGRRQERKEKREKKAGPGMCQGGTRACNSDYGAHGSTLQ